jgi:hypothetical protein
MKSLPVLYYANKNAWMTSQIFKKSPVSWDVELQQKSRKMLLGLDNFAAHHHLKSLKNIQLDFLPPSTTSMVQRTNTGIITDLKTLYHAKFINFILEAIQENLQASSSAANEVSERVDLLHAVQFITNSWRTVSTKTIQNCFADCGFKHLDLEMPNKANSENDTLEMHHIRTYGEFSCVDSSLECYNENEDCEEAVVEQIAAKHQKTSEDQEIDKEDTTKREKVTNRDARKAMKAAQYLN